MAPATRYSIPVTRVMQVPAEKVWAAVEDPGDVYKFHPRVKTSPLINGQTGGGVGSGRVCHFYNGGSIKETVTDQVDGKSVTLLLEGSLPMSYVYAVMTIEPLTDTSCRFNMTMHYNMKYGPVGKAMNALVIKSKMRGIITEVCRALEYHVSTGNLVGNGLKGIPT